MLTLSPKEMVKVPHVDVGIATLAARKMCIVVVVVDVVAEVRHSLYTREFTISTCVADTESSGDR